MNDVTMQTRSQKTKVWTYTKEQIEELPAIIGKEEVSHIAGVSTRTVTRHACANKIRGAFRVGIQWRFNTEEVYRQFGMVR